MAHLKLEKIYKNFGDTQIIKALNLSIIDGEFLTLVGPSGCGKSTLLRIIAGLEQQSSGHVFIADIPVDTQKPSKRDLSMVFQSYALYPHLSVFDNIAVPLRMRLLNFWQRLPIIRKCISGTRQQDKNIYNKVTEVAETLGLTTLLDRKPGKLSGGQRQRVAVGRAIVRQPQAFLFDEPLSNLDAKLRVHMRAEITRLHQQLKTTFIYVTHDQAEAMTMSDRIAVMMEGEIVQIGTPAEVYRNPCDIRVAQFIGSPEINILEGQILDTDLISLWDQLIDISLACAKTNTQSKDSDISIGVRPENIFLVSSSTNHSKPKIIIQGKITLIENLGAEVFAYISINEKGCSKEIMIRLSHEAAIDIHANQLIDIGFLVESLLIFDAVGKRIYSSPSNRNKKQPCANHKVSRRGDMVDVLSSQISV
jgi:multiple sugar transport system ATP-binding protein